MDAWRSVQIRTAMLEKIKQIIDRNIDPTITNTSQFIDLALREKLDKLERKNNLA